LEKWNVDVNRVYKSKLQILNDMKEGLKNYEDTIVDFFNLFDIWIKEKYEGNLICFIDYIAGEVFLIKPS
jgi:hypothetical protein